jgi:hypothetical protein
MNEYYRIKDVPPRGDVGYRLEAVEYDRFSVNAGDPDAIIATNPEKVYFFAQKNSPDAVININKEVTRFGNYQYTSPSGLDFDGTILFDNYNTTEEEETLLYATFHVVDLGINLQPPTIEDVQVTERLEFKNGVSRNFPMKNESLATDNDTHSVKVYTNHYYYIFFNVYETASDESSIVYSSGEDYRLTGYNPIVITRLILDITDVPSIEANRVWFRFNDIVNNDRSEDPYTMYQIIAFAFPV